MRAKLGMLNMPMAMMALTMPAPNTAVIMMADRMAGKASVKSDSRMMSSSTQPRRAAASRPRPAPKIRPMLTAITPTRIELRAPTSNSEATSRPNGSVPSQWPLLGACSLAAMSISYGDQGVQTNDSSAANSSIAESTAPTTKLG